MGKQKEYALRHIIGEDKTKIAGIEVFSKDFLKDKKNSLPQGYHFSIIYDEHTYQIELFQKDPIVFVDASARLIFKIKGLAYATAEATITKKIEDKLFEPEQFNLGGLTKLCADWPHVLTEDTRDITICIPELFTTWLRNYDNPELSTGKLETRIAMPQEIQQFILRQFGNQDQNRPELTALLENLLAKYHK